MPCSDVLPLVDVYVLNVALFCWRTCGIVFLNVDDRVRETLIWLVVY